MEGAGEGKGLEKSSGPHPRRTVKRRFHHPGGYDSSPPPTRTWPRWYLAKLGRKLSRPGLEITPRAMALLERYSWPGNIRELRNALERAILMSEGHLLDVTDFQFEEGLCANPMPVAAMTTAALSLEEPENEALEKSRYWPGAAAGDRPARRSPGWRPIRPLLNELLRVRPFAGSDLSQGVRQTFLELVLAHRPEDGPVLMDVAPPTFRRWCEALRSRERDERYSQAQETPWMEAH